MRNFVSLFSLAGSLLLTAPTVVAQESEYLPDWASLARVEEAPEWFRDAKFGIYFHWGVYAVPAYMNEWYARRMHLDDSLSGEAHHVYEHHVKTYGHPSDFGYHDFVPMFKAEHFDADEWAQLFKRAGARFAGPVAEHHDGFSMWDSDITPWNAMDKGPKRDITGELEQAIRKRGMKFITTFHHARNLQRYRENAAEEMASDRPLRTKFRDSHYPFLAGMPPTSDDPELRLLYGNIPAAEWYEDVWLGKLKEVVDLYNPDLVWFDSWLNSIPESYRKRFAAYYYNHAAERGQKVVVARKQQDLPLSSSIEDFERSGTDRVTEYSWLSDDSVSQTSWSYTTGLEAKPPVQVLHSLIDIVSKNGCLLLNIAPRADGTIPADQRQVLEGIGAWLKINGEAIYDTRPWKEFGEGPARLAKEGGHSARNVAYTAEDVRYTRAKDDQAIYVILMGWPGAGEKVNLHYMKGMYQFDSVELLGSDEEIEWSRPGHKLEITMPSEAPSEMAVVFKLNRIF